MLVRQQVEGMNEALCPGCNEWKLLSRFEPLTPDGLLSETCQTCRLERIREVGGVGDRR
jgi:hypothetical protein